MYKAGVLGCNCNALIYVKCVFDEYANVEPTVRLSGRQGFGRLRVLRLEYTVARGQHHP